MSSLNKVSLIGNLGKDPDIRHTRDGKPIANMRVATSETWKDKDTGDRRERTEWHTVVIFNEGLANVVQRYLHKGSKVYLEGQLRTRKWQDKDGADRYSTEVVLQGFDSKLVMLSEKRRDDRDDRGPAPPPADSDPYGQREYNRLGTTPRASTNGATAPPAAPANGGDYAQQLRDDLKDEVPF